MVVMLLLGLTATAQSRKATRTASGARLELHEKTHHFGDVPRRGDDLVHEFRFTNVGTTPLVLTRVVTSCSCLKAHFSKRPVAPNEEGTIRIVYEPKKSEAGVFNKVIQIYSNDPSGREVITVQGNSLEEHKIKVKNEKVKVKN